MRAKYVNWLTTWGSINLAVTEALNNAKTKGGKNNLVGGPIRLISIPWTSCKMICRPPNGLKER